MWTRKRTASPPQLDASFVTSIFFKLGCEHPRTLRDFHSGQTDRHQSQILNFHLYLPKIGSTYTFRQVIPFHFPSLRSPFPSWKIKVFPNGIKISRNIKETTLNPMLFFLMDCACIGKQSFMPCLWLAMQIFLLRMVWQLIQFIFDGYNGIFWIH